MSLFRGMLHIGKSISFCKFILLSLLTKCLRGPDLPAGRSLETLLRKYGGFVYNSVDIQPKLKTLLT